MWKGIIFLNSPSTDLHKALDIQTPSLILLNYFLIVAATVPPTFPSLSELANGVCLAEARRRTPKLGAEHGIVLPTWKHPAAGFQRDR